MIDIDQIRFKQKDMQSKKLIDQIQIKQSNHREIFFS